MWKQFKVIDADAHMHEPQYLWDRYVEPKYPTESLFPRGKSSRDHPKAHGR